MSVHNRLDEMFRAAKQGGRAALVPYLTAGYPDPDRYVDLATGILEAGADALEVGIPFSDPLLDGPAIQGSQQQALEAGITTAWCLEAAASLHSRSDKPLLFMGAYNPILAYGPDRFCRDAQTAGVSALIIPDLPIEEQGDVRDAAEAASLHLIQLVAPTSTSERVERVCSLATGFVYCISVAGVTGARASVVETARPLVERVRACSDIPVAVGFGIAGPDAVREVTSFADGVIVGSALINLLGAHPAGAPQKFVKALAAAARRSAPLPTHRECV